MRRRSFDLLREVCIVPDNIGAGRAARHSVAAQKSAGGVVV